MNLPFALIIFSIVFSVIGVTNAAENDLNFLIGDWNGSGCGEPGQGITFEISQTGKIQDFKTYLSVVVTRKV